MDEAKLGDCDIFKFFDEGVASVDPSNDPARLRPPIILLAPATPWPPPPVSAEDDDSLTPVVFVEDKHAIKACRSEKLFRIAETAGIEEGVSSESVVVLSLFEEKRKK